MHSRSTKDVLNSFTRGMTVYMPGMSTESAAMYDALQANPDAAAGVRFVSVHFPGINHSDFLGLHPAARQRGYFLSKGLRAGLMDGRAELLPLDYPGIFQDLGTGVDVDIAIAHLTPPDTDGYCSPGPSLDFLPAVWHKARRRYAQINRQLPQTDSSYRVHMDEIDVAFDVDEAPLEYDGGEPTQGNRQIAVRVAALVRDGDVLELGVGRVQTAIVESLVDHRRLSLWSGMVSSSVGALLDAGAISGKRSVQAGVALGDASFYERTSKDDSFYFRPVNETHDLRRIADTPGFCAINSALEVDLFGQVNADVLGGRWIAGVGGLPVFAAGARLSEGGRSIIALPAATDNGKFSRIVAKLGAGLAALPRHCADYVVTEFGVAALRGLTVRDRAAALIEIAAPDFRDRLSAQWDEILRAI